MKSKILEHGLSVVFVGMLFVAALWTYTARQADARARRDTALAPYLSLDSVDLSNAYHRELFRESVAAFYPADPEEADSLLGAIDAYRTERLTSREYKAGAPHTMTADDLLRLAGMYLQFIVVYLITMLLTALAGRSLAVYRFITTRQGRASSLTRLAGFLTTRGGGRGRALPRLLASLALNTLAAFVLFSPAYVVAYALKGRLDTASLLFMVLLAVLTNGVLINYATRFFLLLTGESRKGFVDTALVKNLAADWHWNTPQGVPLRVLWSPRDAALGHVFHHIYLQARYQFLPALKEHASFLITGLIIIEMALNIQGHLGYELLQNILYRRYDIVVTVLFGIFLLVKVTELTVDWRMHRESRRYANEA